MSAISFLLGNLLSSGITRDDQGVRGVQPGFQQIKAEFQQLGQDLQSGNLTQAQSDFATLSQNFPGLTQSTGSTTSGAVNNTVAQAFSQLGQDLQSGKLQAAQQDFTNLQQGLQLVSNQEVAGHHHHRHHHVESSSQESNPIAQAFRTLAQDLQAGNLSGAQSAFATLQNDLQQIGGFLTGGPNGASGLVSPTSAGSLNVTA